MQTDDSRLSKTKSSTVSTSSRKRPKPYRETKRLKAHERRRLILDAAQSILLSQGFSALTLRNTAEAAEIRLATLQYYFSSRDRLFQAAFQDIADQTWADLMSQFDKLDASDSGARLSQFLVGISKTPANSALAGTFTELWAAARTHDFAAKIMQTYYAQATLELARLIQSAYPKLALRRCKQRAVLAISLVEGLTLFVQMDSREQRKPVVSQSLVLESLMALVTAKDYKP